VAHTDGELHLCGPRGRGRKRPAAIEARTRGGSLQRPEHGLPQHRGAWAMAMGVCLAAELVVDVSEVAFAPST
jgi:hypothetical protein